MTILFLIIIWLAFGFLGTYVFEDYLNKKYPSVAEPINVFSQGLFLLGFINFVTSVAYVFVFRNNSR